MNLVYVCFGSDNAFCQEHLPSASDLLHYCRGLKTYFCCILISLFWNVEISLHFNLAFSQCSTSIYQAFDGQTEFCGYLILRFYPTREIRENLMYRTRKMCFTLVVFWLLNAHVACFMS